MRFFVAALAVVLSAAALDDPAILPLEEYSARRDRLRAMLPPDAVAVLAGGDEAERGDLRAAFAQQPDFLYLTGWREPGAFLLITPAGDTLLLPARNEVRERYTGRKLAPGDEDAPARTGFSDVRPAGDFSKVLIGLAEKGSEFHTLTPTPEAITRALPERAFQSLDPKLARLRMIKSSREIALIQRTTDATIAAHKAAWERVRPGLYEYEIAAAMTHVYFNLGCERNAYPPIVASGPNAVILHYNRNRRRMDSGELLLTDVGAECSAYAADLTRTLPVSGRFSRRQKEVYEIVLGAQKAAIAAARPGMTLTGEGEKSLNQIAKAHVARFGLERYYLHGLGHHVGLDVHDRSDTRAPLEPGMVITIEPGVYIAEESIGIRIEDMVLITNDGARVLSSALPREVRDIERAIRRK